MPNPIIFHNRYSKKDEEELVYGDSAIRYLYENPTGRWFEKNLLSKFFLSEIYGWYQSTPLSKFKVDRFVSDFLIPMQDYEEGSFSSFNDFFIRKFKPGVRSFVKEPSIMPAFSEGRYLGFETTSSSTVFPVKGEFLNSEKLLSKKMAEFESGPLLISRLCPVDYHRFHFPDNGKVLDFYRVSGAYHSVNPLALKAVPDVFIKNERHVTILQTENFGKLAYIEVGALCVGKIVQSFSQNLKPIGETFTRGQEKGYFLFGGSTVIVLGERGRWRPAEDILTNTARKIETLVRLGDKVALHL